MNPTVSIILPNYNHCSYLKQRIDSILHQSYQDYELIILDDKSTDESLEVIRTYSRHPCVAQVIVNAENTGNTFMQWEKGFSLAKGKYIWIAESDDYSHPDFLKQCVKELDKSPRSAFAYTGSFLVDAKSRPYPGEHDFFNYFDLLRSSVRYSGRGFVHRKMLQRNGVYNASMVVFRKSFLKNLSPVYQTFRWCGDWIFWSELAMQGEVIRINRKLNYYRQHTNKVTYRSVKDRTYIGETLKATLYLTQLSQPPAGLRARAFGSLYRFINRQSSIDEQEKKELTDRIKKIYPNLKTAYIYLKIRRFLADLFHPVHKLLLVKKFPEG